MTGGWDLLVLGAGPAGLAAAIHAAAGGLSTVVVARELPSTKPVSRLPTQSLHPGVQTVLRTLGAPEAAAASSRGTYERIWSAGVSTELGQDAEGRWVGHHVDRRSFDAALASHACAVGVTIVQDAAVAIAEADYGVTVTCRSGMRVTATFVVDATGRSNFASRALALGSARWSPALVARTGLTRTRPDLAEADTDPTFVPSAHGWTWLAPENDGMWTFTQVCRVVPGGEAAQFSAMPTLRTEGGPTLVDVAWTLSRRRVGRRTILVGDAAGRLDPAAGHGVLFALLSGAQAAHLLRAQRSRAVDPLVLAAYDRWFGDLYGRRVDSLRERYSNVGVRM